MIISIIHEPSLTYPPKNNIFCERNNIAKDISILNLCDSSFLNAMKRLLAQMETQPSIYKDLLWNPLGRWIRPGMKVFILPNFVYHPRPGESELNFQGKCTHGSVLAAIIEYCLRAVGKQGQVLFGNAPLQSCNWSSVLQATGADLIVEKCKSKGLQVDAVDLRFFISRLSKIGYLKKIERRTLNSDLIEIDLGNYSLLDEIYINKNLQPKFRVADYNPKRTESFHNHGSHRYIIHKKILEADVIIHVPKLKTHELVGVTLGLKSSVGTIGHKDCLAHFRLGALDRGGDEYPNDYIIKNMSSKLHDFIFSGSYPHIFTYPFQIFDRAFRSIIRKSLGITAGAWHGNDTAWRMALDIARILHYTDKAGELKDSIQRQQLLIVDGIVGGEGEGPLSPKGVRAGLLIFSDNVAWGDRIACRLMGYDPQNIPIVREAFRDMRFSLIPKDDSPKIIFNGQIIEERDLKPVLGRPFMPAMGWRKHLLKNSERA
jgi:uncharacterized protein (DUF362 family)